MTDSSTGGILNNPNIALNDVALDSVFQGFFASITQLTTDNVRLRWTPEPQTPPDFNATWCAVGVTEIRDDGYPYQEFIDGVGIVMHRHEYLDVLASFYGPKAQQAMRAASDGVLIVQNNEGIMSANGIVFTHYSDPIKAPQLMQNRWANRIDRTFTFRRQIQSTYDVLSIQEMDGTMTNGTLSSTLKTDT